MGPVMTVDELNAFIQVEFPQAHGDFKVESVATNAVTARLIVQEKHLRPGGTVSGPSMFGLADVSIYFATLAMIGPEALAVTTNISMDFMNKPVADRDLICEARLLKLGKRLSVGDCLIHSEGSNVPVARASMTYSIPPKRPS